VQVHPAGWYFGEEIEQSVGADRDDGGNSQPENEDREQQNPAPCLAYCDRSARRTISISVLA
jgi:hypothetical protein